MSATAEQIPIARRLDVTPDAYHADPCDTPSLSSGVAHTLIARSPLHAWAAHPKLGGVPREATKEMDQGTLVHTLLLGKGSPLCVVDADSFRTKAARELRDEAKENGQTPVLKHEYEGLLEIVGHLHERIKAEGGELTGEAEVAIEWHEPGEYGPVRCRRMIDMLDTEAPRVTELKTISSADPHTCARQAYTLGYDIAYAATVSALQQYLPEQIGRLTYQHIFVEKAPSNEKPRFKPPYAVVVREVDGMFEELGMRRWRRAVKLWEQCLRMNRWPGYSATPLTVPAWAVSNEEFATV